jgi:hypothetical protein
MTGLPGGPAQNPQPSPPPHRSPRRPAPPPPPGPAAEPANPAATRHHQPRHRGWWWRVPSRLRWPVWMLNWPSFRAALQGWWYSASAYEVRAAILDTGRHPGLVVLGIVAVFWPLSGFTWIPLAVAAGAWLAVYLCTRPVRWWLRWRVRRATLPTIGIITLVVLTGPAGPFAWGIAIGLWLMVAGVTDNVRARRRLLAWICQAVARAVRVDPTDLRVRRAEWDRRRLTWAEVDTRGRLRVEDPAVRERIAGAVEWSLRHAGGHTVTWPAGLNTFEVTADPALPELVDEQHWPADLPGIPIGVTDTANADGVVDTVDAVTGETMGSLPVLLIHPGDSQRHYLIVGGTGAGKSNFTRGLIARALRMGWFPGGAFIFDGKAGSDYIVFEGREGVRCVAREPQEWEENMTAVAEMMRTRYEEDAAYHRGQTGKPDHPRWLVVLEEFRKSGGHSVKRRWTHFCNRFPGRSARPTAAWLWSPNGRIPRTRSQARCGTCWRTGSFLGSCRGPARGWCWRRIGRPSPTSTDRRRCLVGDWRGSPVDLFASRVFGSTRPGSIPSWRCSTRPRRL